MFPCMRARRGGPRAQCTKPKTRTRFTSPEKLGLLSEPHRYEILYGGRGGIKSWSIAQHLLIAGAKQTLRIPCARETMQSIRDSVHQLLEDQIQRLGLPRVNSIGQIVC